MINNISVVANSKGRSVDFNGIAADAINSTDDIHPQYNKNIFLLAAEFSIEVYCSGSDYEFSQFMTLPARLVQRIYGGWLHAVSGIVGLSGISQEIGYVSFKIPGYFKATKMSISGSGQRQNNEGEFTFRVLTYKDGAIVSSLSPSYSITSIGSWAAFSSLDLPLTDLAGGEIVEIVAGLTCGGKTSGPNRTTGKVKNIKVWLHN